MLFTHIEQQLIEAGKAYRASPHRDITALFDGTPFVEIANGIKARATLKNGEWVFRAIVRNGHGGFDCSTLSEALELAQNEAIEHRKKLLEEINNNKGLQ